MFAILLSEKMDPFYQNVCSFPTAVFTFVLLVCLFYWLGAVLGLVDLDVLDFDLPEGGGADAATPHVLAGLMLKFGLHGVPVTVIISFVALIGWLVCYFAVYFIFETAPDGWLRYIAGVPIFLLSLYLGLIATGHLIKPIRPFFSNASQETVTDVLGQIAVVRSSRLDSQVGEVFLQDGGAGLILKARAEGQEVYSKGQRVVLLEYKQSEHVYRVTAADG